MQKRTWLFAAAIAALTATPTQALDLSPLIGTMEVTFHPIQSAGIREGCSLVYRAVGQDHAYRKGNLITVVGNISYTTGKKHSAANLLLKIGTANTVDSVDRNAKFEAPFFAYIQTPHGTTARSKSVQRDGDPGFRLFVYQLEGDTMKVLEDISDGAPVTIGFNRKKDGLDVLVPLDLSVAESTVSAAGSFNRRHSDEMLRQFMSCVGEVTEQALKQLETK